MTPSQRSLHPDSDEARAAALLATPESLMAMFEHVRLDRDQFGTEYAAAAFEQLAAVAIARAGLDAQAARLAVAPPPAVITEQRARARRRQMRAVSTDEQITRSTLYGGRRSVTVMPGDGPRGVA